LELVVLVAQMLLVIKMGLMAITQYSQQLLRLAVELV
jgi:hypothetical protein